MQKSDIVDVEKIVEQGKSILTGDALPKTSQDVTSALENFSSEVEQVRYTEGEKLSSAGQTILKDLEEILIGGAEVSSAIPPETFLHAARAQQKVAEGVSVEGTESKVGSELGKVGEEVAMNMSKLLKMMFTSNEFREVVVDWSAWLKDVAIVQLEVAQANVESAVSSESEEKSKEIGQVSIEKDTENISNKIPKIKDEQLDKMISMLEWMQEREEYQTAMGYIFNEFSNLSSILGIEEGEGVVDVDKLKEASEELNKVGNYILKALENWTHRSTANLKQNIQSIAKHLKSDDHLRNAIQAFAHFLSNCFNEPGFLNDRKWIREESRDRIDEVREAIGEGYRKDFEGLAEESRELIKSLDLEPRTANLKRGFKKLVEDLFVDGGEGGSFRLKTELLGDMSTIVSGLLERVKYLRVPDIEIHDEDLDFVARDIILDAAELVPQQFKMTFVTENMIEKIKNKEAGSSASASSSASGLMTEEEKERIFVELEPPKVKSKELNENEPASWQSHLKFEVKGIHGHCRNIHFNLHKRTGFPQLTDEGLADLRVWGPKGMLIKIVFRPEWVEEETVESEIHTKEIIESSSASSSHPKIKHQEPQSTTTKTTSIDQKFKLTIVKVRCDIDELDLDLHGTRRDWFYSVMGSIVRKRVKSALESAVEGNLLTLLD